MKTSNLISSLHASCPRAHLGTRQGIRGFTLIELLIVMAIAAVLVGAAAPSMTGLIKSIQLTSASNDLLAGLLRARSEAIKRRGRGVVCKSADGISCAAGGGWAQGWIVFHDVNNNGTREGDEIIFQWQEALAADLRATGNQNVARYVSYAPNGVTKMASGAFQAGTLTLCHESASGGEARQIILSSSGRPRVQKTQIGSCT